MWSCTWAYCKRLLWVAIQGTHCAYPNLKVSNPWQVKVSMRNLPWTARANSSVIYSKDQTRGSLQSTFLPHHRPHLPPEFLMRPTECENPYSDTISSISPRQCFYSCSQDSPSIPIWGLHDTQVHKLLLSGPISMWRSLEFFSKKKSQLLAVTPWLTDSHTRAFLLSSSVWLSSRQQQEEMETLWLWCPKILF